MAAATVRMGAVEEGRAVQVQTHFVSAFDLWFPKQSDQRILWPSTVRLSEEAGELQLEVSDDGAGFDPATSTPRDGLTTARDRIEALGGLLSIDSEPGRGTRIAATVPLYGALPVR